MLKRTDTTKLDPERVHKLADIMTLIKMLYSRLASTSWHEREDKTQSIYIDSVRRIKDFSLIIESDAGDLSLEKLMKNYRSCHANDVDSIRTGRFWENEDEQICIYGADYQSYELKYYVGAPTGGKPLNDMRFSELLNLYKPTQTIIKKTMIHRPDAKWSF